jgi:hypothetical protein
MPLYRLVIGYFEYKFSPLFVACKTAFIPLKVRVPASSGNNYELEAQNLLGCTAALMMEAARTSETSVDIQLRTRQYIPEDSELHTRRRENLKSQLRTFLYRLGPVI